VARKANGPSEQDFTHIWHAHDGDIPCTPTGAKGEIRDGVTWIPITSPILEGMTYANRDELVLRPPKRAKAAPQPLSAADLSRLDSWALELVTAVKGAGREEASGDWRFGANDALLLGRSGRWYDFSASRGGFGAQSLLEFLHGDKALEIAQAWLAQHAGDGRLGRDDGSDEDDDAQQTLADIEHQAFIDGLLERAQPVTESPAAMQYYAGRNLDPVSTGAVEHLRVLPNWRGDEIGILAKITDNDGRVVGIQVLHITPNGEKSTVQPVRKLLRGPHDWR
jgi:hypothetical protein